MEEPTEDVPADLADDAPDDPFAGASQRRIGRLARRADRLRRRRPAALADLAESAGVDVRRLRLLADAYAEGAGSGVRALGPAPPTEPEPMAAAVEELERWRSRQHPFDGLDWEVWRNRITVTWLVADPDRGETARRPLLQLRRTADGRWHLYSRAAHGEWWPVVVSGAHRRQTVADALRAVELDAANRFWSAAPTAPPREGR